MGLAKSRMKLAAPWLHLPPTCHPSQTGAWVLNVSMRFAAALLHKEFLAFNAEGDVAAQGFAEERGDMENKVEVAVVIEQGHVGW